MYICIYMYINICICICIYIYVYTNICTYLFGCRLYWFEHCLSDQFWRYSHAYTYVHWYTHTHFIQILIYTHTHMTCWHVYIRTPIQHTRIGFIDLGTVFSISFDFTMAQSFDERRVYSCIYRCIYTHVCVHDICLIQLMGTQIEMHTCLVSNTKIPRHMHMHTRTNMMQCLH